MKKKYSVLIAVLSIVIISAFFGGCTTNDIEESETHITDIADSETIRELKAFNASLPVVDKTRASLMTFAKWTAIILSDASGAYTGAVLGGKVGSFFGPHGTTTGAIVGAILIGGASSHNIYKLTTQIENFSPYRVPAYPPDATATQQTLFETAYASGKSHVLASDYTNGLICGLDSCSTRIGILHNKILENIEIMEQSYEFVDTADNLTALEKKVIASPMFIDGYQQVLNQPPLQEEYTGDNKGEYILHMFLSEINKFMDSPVQIRCIIQNYTAIVGRSPELTSSEKQALWAAFSVCQYSRRYWIDFMKKQ